MSGFYNFKTVDKVPVKEFFFPKGSCVLGMAFSLNSKEYSKRKSYFVPDFNMDEKGNVLCRRSKTKVCKFPSRQSVKKQIHLAIKCAKADAGFILQKSQNPWDYWGVDRIPDTRTEKQKGKMFVHLCYNEETYGIGICVVRGNDWEPIYSQRCIKEKL